MRFGRMGTAALFVLATAGIAATATAQQQAMAGDASAATATKPWYKQPWNPANVKACDRACLVRIGETYLSALESKSMATLPLAEQVIATENTGKIDLGEGVLWRAAIKPTPFKVVVADPAYGQVAIQTVLNIDGKPALVAFRLRVERGMITEAEQMYDRNVAPEAMELLQKPVAVLTEDVPAKQRASREMLKYAAESYFDALTGEDGRIAAFAPDCVRHEQGYQTVFNKQPGRASPSPKLPDLSTEQGRTFSRLSTMTCEEQVSTGIFVGMKRIWPHRALVIDEQKQLVATFPFFVHDGTKRPFQGKPAAPGPIAMVLNLTMMETFAIRNSQIKHVEAFPFVIVPYGTGDGWTHPKLH